MPIDGPLPSSRLPRVRVAVSTAAMGTELLVFDTASSRLHVLNAAATAVFNACRHGLSGTDLVDHLHTVTGQPRAQLEADVAAGLDQLRREGLLTDEPADPHGRHGSPEPTRADRPSAVGPPLPHEKSPRFSVLGEVVALSAADAGLLAQARSLLADLATELPPTARLDIVELGSGRLGTSGEPWGRRTWPTTPAFLDHLPTLLNLLTAHTRGCLAIHAGAVRHPEGGVMVLAGTSGAGKSTLTAALVQTGWGYLTDEAVAVEPQGLATIPFPKPLALDPHGRRLLGLGRGHAHTPVTELRPGAAVTGPTAGVVRAVVLPERQRSDSTRLELIDAGGPAAIAVATHALNLLAAGSAGVQAIAGLATNVPVWRFVHGGVEEGAAAALTALAERHGADLGMVWQDTIQRLDADGPGRAGDR